VMDRHFWHKALSPNFSDREILLFVYSDSLLCSNLWLDLLLCINLTLIIYLLYLFKWFTCDICYSAYFVADSCLIYILYRKRNTLSIFCKIQLAFEDKLALSNYFNFESKGCVVALYFYALCLKKCKAFVEK